MKARTETNKWFLADMPSKITQLVDGESDRGAILILSAYLEELLGELIRAACVSNKHAEKLLDFHQPAGDFSSKISLCTALGFIHETEAAALSAVRKIRNSAAHFDKKGKGFDVLFDSDKTIDQVGNLTEALNIGHPPRESEAVKELFVLACRLLATKIMIRAVEVETPESPLTIKEMANKYRPQMQGTEAGERVAALEALLKEGEYEMVSNYFKDIAKHIKQKIESDEIGDPEKPKGHNSPNKCMRE